MQKYDISINLEASNNPEEIKESKKAEKLEETEEQEELGEHSNIDEEEAETIFEIYNLIQLNKENDKRKKYLLRNKRLLERLKTIVADLENINGPNNRTMKDISLKLRRLTRENASFIKNCVELKKSIRFLFGLKMNRLKELQEIRFENASTDASRQDDD